MEECEEYEKDEDIECDEEEGIEEEEKDELQTDKVCIAYNVYSKTRIISFLVSSYKLENSSHLIQTIFSYFNIGGQRRGANTGDTEGSS